MATIKKEEKKKPPLLSKEPPKASSTMPPPAAATKPDGSKDLKTQAPAINATNQALEDKLTGKTPLATEEVKSKRGPYKKKDATATPPPVERVIPTVANPMYMAFLLTMGKIIAKRTAPEMELTPEEAEGLALPLTQIIAYHFPNTSPIVLVYFHMAIATVGVVLPRLMILGEIEKKKKEAAETLKAPPGMIPIPAISGTGHGALNG